MRRHAFTPVHAMVVIILLSSLLAAATSAQPAPCPAAYPFDPAVGTCVDPETGEPVNPATGGPLNPGEDGEPTAAPTVELPEGDLASFTIYHLACDDDFDPNGVRDGGGLGSANGCLTYGTPPFTYTISANGTEIITSTIEAVERDFARFNVPGPIPAGALTITVAPVADYTTEFISCGLSIGDGPTDVIEPAIAGGAATLSTLPDQDVECWVYNVTRMPADTTITGGGGTVNMSFLSVACPAGTVINADLDRICTDGLANVSYEILSETETLARNVTDGNGVLIFENVPDGQLAMVQSAPAGYGKPYVLCTHYSPTTGDREYAPTIEFGTGFMATVAPGDDLNCTWFNFPAAGPDNGPTIMIQTRWCEGYENGFAPDATLAEAETACPPFSPYEEFQVSLDGQAVATDKSNDINGQVTFTKLPVSENGGPYGIALLNLPDAQTLVVYCDKGTGDGGYAVVPSPLTGSNRIDQQLVAGETLRCSWFINYPEGSTWTGFRTPSASDFEPGIILVARLCNPGADLTQSDIDAACPTAGDDIAFNVDASGQPYLNTTTNTEGMIDVPLPGGDATFTITPQVPTGYDVPGYLCVSIQNGGGGGGKVVRLTADLPSHDFTWSSNSETTCTYYFPVMAEEDAAGDTNEDDAVGEVAEQTEMGEVPGNQVLENDGATENGNATAAHTLTLQFWTCPDSVDSAAGHDVLEQTCSVESTDRSFMLTIDGQTTGETISGATTWEFQSSPVYADIGTSASSTARCESSWPGNDDTGVESPEDVVLEDGALTLTAANSATTIYCDWFLFTN